MRVGYVRVSSPEQNLERQLDGVGVEKIFEDRVSGKDKNRPGLAACLDFLREGDELFVHSIDRLARNLLDLQTLVDSLVSKSVTVHFVKENLKFTSAESSSPLDKMMLHILGAFAEFERSLIRERQKEGFALAKKRGKRIGRPKCFTDEQKIKIIERCKTGESKDIIAKDYNVSRMTIYNLYRKQLLET